MTTPNDHALITTAPTFEYMRVPEDDAQLIRYLDRNWRPRRRKIRLRRAFLLIWTIFAGFWFSFVFGSPALFVLFPLSIALAVFFPVIWRKRFIRHQRKAGAYNRGQRISTTPQGLLLSSSAADVLLKWDAITTAQRQGQWMYITVRDQQTINIPLGTLNPEQTRAMEDVIQHYTTRALPS